jgi:anti-sigma-K factor RskA
MNVEEYISSGILEQYVLGELTEQEEAQIRALASLYPEIKAEIEQIEDTIEKLAHSYGRKPPVDLRQRIMEQNYPSSDQSRSTDYWPYLVAASLSLLVISTVFSIYFYRNNQELLAENQSLLQRNSVIADDLNKTFGDLEITNQKLSVVLEQETKTVSLLGLDKSPGSLVKVYWNVNDGTTLCLIEDLPEPPDGKQYQLWYLLGGQPYDAGLVNYESGLQEMIKISKAEAFAITLEPTGGSTSPTLEEMYVLGSIS